MFDKLCVIEINLMKYHITAFVIIFHLVLAMGNKIGQTTYIPPNIDYIYKVKIIHIDAFMNTLFHNCNE